MIHMKHVTRDDLIKQLVKKMAPPLGKPSQPASVDPIFETYD
jgi:hypothetical protein